MEYEQLRRNAKDATAFYNASADEKKAELLLRKIEAEAEFERASPQFSELVDQFREAQRAYRDRILAE